MPLFAPKPTDAPAGHDTDEPPRFCIDCRYDLRGLQKHRCPECGRDFDPADGTTFLRDPDERRSDVWPHRVVALTLVLIPAEFCCAALAYHTVGEVYSAGMMIGLVFVANAFVMLTCLLKRPRITAVLLLLIAVLIVPDQLRLGVRLLMLNAEAGGIIRHVEQVRRDTQSHPATLAAYTYQFPSNRRHVQSYRPSPRDGGYIFYWYVGTPTASHWYSPKGGWGYYPD